MGAQGNTKQHLKDMNSKKGLILFLLLGPTNLDCAGGFSAHTLLGHWQLVLRLVICLLPGSQCSFPACSLAQLAVHACWD